MKYQFQFQEIVPHLPMLVLGVWVTIKISAAAMIMGFGVGIAGAVARASDSRTVRLAVAVYVEVIRNTPFLVQIFFLYFGLPQLHIRLSADAVAVIALTINLGAYATEIVRAGIESTDKGQLEAARALGLKPVQAFLLVVLPPALSRVWPSITSQFVLMMLTSSVVSQISVEDLSGAASFVQSFTFRSFEVYLVSSALYIALAYAFRFALEGFAWLMFRANRAAAVSRT